MYLCEDNEKRKLRLTIHFYYQMCGVISLHTNQTVLQQTPTEYLL